MLMSIATLFLILWLVGLGTGYTVGGLIHILPLVAVLIVLFRMYQTRRIS
jgi:hypothetical protein